MEVRDKIMLSAGMISHLGRIITTPTKIMVCKNHNSSSLKNRKDSTSTMTLMEALNAIMMMDVMTSIIKMIHVAVYLMVTMEVSKSFYSQTK